MNSSVRRGQTTKGVWMAGEKNQKVLIIDCEGTDSKSRSDDDRGKFEHSSSLFALAMSDVLTVKERMIFVKGMNKKEQNKMKKKVLISYNKSLTKQKEHIEQSLTFTPSKIAQNCLSFITQQDESQYGELLSNDINDALPKEMITQIKDQLIIIIMLIKSDKDNIRSIYSQSVKDLYLILQSKMTLLKINNISK